MGLMGYSFEAFGHKNILATHNATLEFTKDSGLSKRGNCIIGVRSNFDLNHIKKFFGYKEPESRLCIKIMSGGSKFVLNARINPDFNDAHEIVIRKSKFKSSRTLATDSDAAAIDIPRSMVRPLQMPDTMIKITFS